MTTSSKFNDLESIIKEMVEGSYAERNFDWITGADITSKQDTREPRKFDDEFLHSKRDHSQFYGEFAPNAIDFPSSSNNSKENFEYNSLSATSNNDKTLHDRRVHQPDSEHIEPQLLTLSGFKPTHPLTNSSNVNNKQTQYFPEKISVCPPMIFVGKDKSTKHVQKYIPVKKQMDNGADTSKKTFKFLCHIPGCGKIYTQFAHLKTHLDWHATENNFVCPHCQKKFASKDDLMLHVKTHANVTHEKKVKINNVNSQIQQNKNVPSSLLLKTSVREESSYKPKPIEFNANDGPQYACNLPPCNGHVFIYSKTLKKHLEWHKLNCSQATNAFSIPNSIGLSTHSTANNNQILPGILNYTANVTFIPMGSPICTPTASVPVMYQVQSPMPVSQAVYLTTNMS